MSFVYDLYVDNNLDVRGNTTIEGNLHVHGTTTSVDTVNLNIKDHHVYLNNGYTSNVGESGGIVVNTNAVASANITDTTSQFTAPSSITTSGSATYQAGQRVEVTGTTSNNTTFTVVSHIGTALVVSEASVVTETVAGTLNLLSDGVSGTGFTTTSVVNTLGTASFTAGDIVQISSSVTPFTGEIANLGMFEVSAHVGTVLTINTSSVFAQTEFVASTTNVTDLIITKVLTTIMNANATGTWQTATGSTAATISSSTKDILLAGGSALINSITLTGETNQIALGTSGVVTLSAPSASSSTVTFPDTSGVNDTIAYTTFAQTLLNKTLTLPKINDTSSDHTYNLLVSELVADRDVTLPLLTTNDTFVFEDHAQTLSNKTLTAPQVNDTSADHQYIFGVSELVANRTVTLPLLISNDTFVFEEHIQTLANKTLTLPKINDLSSDNTYNFIGSELAADRDVTLPVLAVADTFVFELHTQTLSNKTNVSAVGAVGAPSYSFVGHTDDGIYHDGANNVNVAIDGANVLAVTSTGITVTGSITADAVIPAVETFNGGGPYNITKAVTIVDTESSSQTLNLPAAPTEGETHTVLNLLVSDANLTVSGNGNNIDGQATQILRRTGHRFTMMFLSNDWYIVN
jgi:hypothetical protein